jgi:hypothetical protein
MNTNAIDKIPKGDYCYSILETPNKSNGFKLKIKRCPFWIKETINGAPVITCRHLEIGCLDAHLMNREKEEEAINKLCQHYHVDKDELFNKHLVGDFLWDSVKHCNINIHEEL